MTTVVKFEMFLKQKKAEKAVSVVSFVSSSGGFIEGNNYKTKEGLLMDDTSSIYLFVKFSDLASFIFLFFTRFCRNSDSHKYK